MPLICSPGVWNPWTPWVIEGHEFLLREILVLWQPMQTLVEFQTFFTAYSFMPPSLPFPGNGNIFNVLSFHYLCIFCLYFVLSAGSAALLLGSSREERNHSDGLFRGTPLYCLMSRYYSISTFKSITSCIFLQYLLACWNLPSFNIIFIYPNNLSTE